MLFCCFVLFFFLFFSFSGAVFYLCVEGIPYHMHEWSMLCGCLPQERTRFDGHTYEKLNLSYICQISLMYGGENKKQKRN